MTTTEDPLAPAGEQFRRPVARSSVRSPLVHDLIASPFLDDYVVLRPGSTRGIKIGPRRHRELERVADQECPQWLVDAVRRRWPDLDLSNLPVGQSVLVRSVSPYGSGARLTS